MTGIDTNVLVRYLIQDDPVQAKAATRFIEGTCTKDSPGFLNHLVLCETLWVLEGCYDQPRGTLIRTIEQILRVAQLRVDEPQIAWQALEDYRNNQVDFADHLLGRINRSNDCRTTMTFDRQASKSPEFTLLK